MRLTVVTNIPTPYRTPLFDETDRLLGRMGGSLTVIYGAHSRPDRQWAEYQPECGGAQGLFVPYAQLRLGRRATEVSPLVVRYIARTGPDVVIVGGFAPWGYVIAGWCAYRRIPLVLWSGETVRSARLFGSRRIRRRPLIDAASAALAYGPSARDYLVSIGMPPDRIAVIGNGIDVRGFARAVDARRPDREMLRKALGLRGNVILSIGGKGAEPAIPALDLLPEPVTLLVVGREDLQFDDPRVRNLGRQAPSEMPGIYAVGDCLLHMPVYDRWPHAVNEALSAGIPVIANRNTGAPEELFAAPGCALVDESDPTEIAAALRRAFDLRTGERPRAREAIRSSVMPWDVREMAARMVAAAQAAERPRGTIARTG